MFWAYIFDSAVDGLTLPEQVCNWKQIIWSLITIPFHFRNRVIWILNSEDISEVFERQHQTELNWIHGNLTVPVSPASWVELLVPLHSFIKHSWALLGKNVLLGLSCRKIFLISTDKHLFQLCKRFRNNNT